MEYILYKIVCNDLDIKYTYVGSTKNCTRRKCKHKADSKDTNRSTSKVYSVVNEHGGWENWTMVKIETCICDSNLDARIRERYFYEELSANLNANRPRITSEENDVWIKYYGKQYYLIMKLPLNNTKNNTELIMKLPVKKRISSTESIANWTLQHMRENIM